ncbi:hypothetical protein AB0I49_03270 [Streptomyces sp. NPDC050617]|uniref:hypothetical protein n=1 Tax=Streptomyces sp. NPDC050617 TaxID=3154628 RepID=UPI003428FED1
MSWESIYLGVTASLRETGRDHVVIVCIRKAADAAASCSYAPACAAGLVALYAGLALTVIATAVAFVGQGVADVLSRHIRAGYPDIGQAEVASGARVYLTYLAVVGAVGVAAWLWTAWAVRKRKRWARTGATVVFLLGGSIALTNLLIKDTSGDTGLPALLGWVGMLPSAAGLIAVVLLWRGRRG